MREERYRKNDKNNQWANKGGDNSRAKVSAQIDNNGPGDAIQAQPLEVKVYGNNFEKALKAFRALVQKERILSTYKEKQTYEKASDKRRRKRNEMKRKMMELDGDTKRSSAHTKGFDHKGKHKDKPPYNAKTQ